MGRLIIAGVVAGLAVFVWGVISHVVLPLGEAGIRSMPNEAPVIESLRANVPEKGLYFFPGFPGDGSMTEEQQNQWAARLRAGPHGILIYDPAGAGMISLRQLAIEVISSILAALLLGYLLSFTSLSLTGRVAFGAGAGLMAWLAVSIPHWNWYQFPIAFTLAEGLDQVVAWGLAALVLSLIARRRATA